MSEQKGTRKRATTPMLTEQQTGEALLTLNASEIRPSRHNPRRVFVAAQDEELERSVASMGIVQPVLVRPAPDDGGPPYELVCGERRWRAAVKVGCTVPAVMRTLTDAQSFEIALIENLQREDMTPLDESDAFAYMRDTLGYSVETIAGKASVTEIYVKRRLALQSLGTVGRALLASGKLNGLGAVELAGLGTAQQEQICAQIDSDPTFTPEQGASRRNVLELIRQSLTLRQIASATFDPTRVDLIAGVRDCGSCPKNSAAQRGLFSDNAEKAAECGDPACWSRKTSAAWEERKATNVDGRLSFIEGGSAAEYFGPAGGFSGGSALVPVDRVRLPSGCLLGEDGAKNEKIAALLQASKRTLVRNPNKPDQIVECISPEVVSAIRALEEKNPAAEEDDSAKAEKRKAREEAKEKRKARDLMIEDLRAALDEDMSSLPEGLGSSGTHYHATRQMLIELLRAHGKGSAALAAAHVELGDDSAFRNKSPRSLLIWLLTVLVESLSAGDQLSEACADLFAGFGISEGDALSRVKKPPKSSKKQ